MENNARGSDRAPRALGAIQANVACVPITSLRPSKRIPKRLHEEHDPRYPRCVMAAFFVAIGFAAAAALHPPTPTYKGPPLAVFTTGTAACAPICGHRP
jgi:hypothetical protein